MITRIKTSKLEKVLQGMALSRSEQPGEGAIAEPGLSKSIRVYYSGAVKRRYKRQRQERETGCKSQASSVVAISSTDKGGVLRPSRTSMSDWSIVLQPVEGSSGKETQDRRSGVFRTNGKRYNQNDPCAGELS